MTRLRDPREGLTRFLPGLYLWLCLLTIGPGLDARPILASGPGLRPDSWGGYVSLGRDHRAQRSAEIGDPALGTGDSRFWFAEPNDGQGQIQVWGRWKFRSLFQRSRVHLAYTRIEWTEGRILGRDLFELELFQKLSARSELELDLGHAPQIYLRHRLDKDASPGDPRFRPEAYREMEGELTFTRNWTPRLDGSVFINHSRRDETRWFPERDRRRWGAGLSFDRLLGERTRIGPDYEFRVSRSRNQPDLGSDLSYREHVAGLKLRIGTDALAGSWDLELNARCAFRRYTTDDPGDSRRYRRNEQIYYWMAKLRRPIPPWTPFLAAESSGRWVDVPTSLETAEEDGQVDRTLIRLGLEWSF